MVLTLYGSLYSKSYNPTKARTIIIAKFYNSIKCFYGAIPFRFVILNMGNLIWKDWLKIINKTTVLL